ncbi:MAG: hypothetical protein PHU21_09725, partial [Elusimicrobia bacterium]|nr:hypothetical protein [Elusimicrobiota bacterium]
MTAEELFAPQGPLARAEPGYESRPQQARMASAVMEALARGGGLVVEAGTGVGKSLAYLLPGALWAASGGRRLQVSTHTRALQDQILSRELPTVARILGSLGQPLSCAMLMGADNYLCVRRLERLVRSPERMPDPSRLALEELSAWARTAETGLRSRLPGLVPQGLWRRICRSPELCLGQRPGRPAQCGRCLYRCDRQRAERAQVLVVNHALLLSAARLPPRDALVVDEAHTLPDVAADHFGAAVTVGRFLSLAEDAAALVRRAAGRGVGAAGPWAEARRRAKLCAEEGPRFLQEIAARHGFSEGTEEPGGRLLERPAQDAEPPALPALERGLAEVRRLCQDLDDEFEAHVLQARAAALRRDLQEILG